jgi:phospholipase/carboxylesterase
VAGIVPMSGRLLPEAWQARAPDEALRGLPVFAVHGTRDTVLPIHEGRAIRDALQTLPIDLVYREYNMAHEVTAQSLADIAAWLTAQLDGKTLRERFSAAGRPCCALLCQATGWRSCWLPRS